MDAEGERKLFQTLGALNEGQKNINKELKQAREDRKALFTCTGENAKQIGILQALKGHVSTARIISISSLVAVVILGVLQLRCGG